MLVSDSVVEKTGILRFNRPERRNALHPDMLREFLEKFSAMQQDEEIQSIIISGNGTAFCAGADLEYLKELAAYSPLQNEADSRLLASFFLSIYESPKPVIAAVNGPAIAGGCGIATACDYIIANQSSARFGYSEVKIGFIPAIVAVFLTRRIGEARAQGLLLSGEVLGAREAAALGLADSIADDPLAAAIAFSRMLNQNSSASMAETKKLLLEISPFHVRRAVETAIACNTRVRSTPGFISGINSFLNK